MTQPRYLDFDRSEWSALRANTPLTLTEEDIEKIRGINVLLDMDMVEHTYLPLSRLLNLHVQGSHQLATVTDTFLGSPPTPVKALGESFSIHQAPLLEHPVRIEETVCCHQLDPGMVGPTGEQLLEHS